MIHELVTGASPFPTADRVATALHHQLHSTPDPLDEIDPRVPTALAEAVARSMHKDPAERFATVADFAAAAAAPSNQHTAGRPAGAGRRARILVGAATVIAASGLAVWITTRSAGDDPIAAAPQTQTQETVAPNDTGVDAENPPLITNGTTPPGDQPVPVVPDSDWVSGASAELACNQLQGSDFANGTVPVDYFGDPPGRERVVTDVGYAGSWGLEIGQPGAFGQYGEIIPILPGETYSFVGWFNRNGEIADTEIGISFLTSDYQPLSAGAAAEASQNTEAFVGVTAVPAPADAGFAVPYVFKDGSEGVLIADELIFGVAADCQADIETAGL